MDTEAEHELRYTLYVKTYGFKNHCVKAVGQTLARSLYTLFGDRVRLVDHRSQPIVFDPDAHDFGLGES